MLDNNTPRLYMPIGPSGCGKSTLYSKLQQWNPELVCLSKDIMRESLYGNEDYTKSWNAANADPQFDAKVRLAFQDILQAKRDVYIDNTNLSPKVRNRWLLEAKQHKYYTLAIVFNIDVDELLLRQTTRVDKAVPVFAIHQQVAAFKLPVVGEFSEVQSIEYITEKLKYGSV